MDAAGRVAATAGGDGSVSGAGGTTPWTPPAPLTLTRAALWHAQPRPALYTLATTVSVGGALVDAVNVTFGVRSVVWDGARGFILNGNVTKILGASNHQVRDSRSRTPVEASPSLTAYPA